MTNIELRKIIDLAVSLKEAGFRSGIEALCVDADTTLQTLERVETWLYGLRTHGLLDTFFATLEAFPVHSHLALSERVDEIHAGRWWVYNEIRTPAELGYWLAHECDEYAEQGADLDDPEYRRLAEEALTEGRRWETAALVEGRGYVVRAER